MLVQDLSAFLTDFAATSCTVGGATVKGIFDNGFAESFGMGGSGPTLLLQSSDATSAARGTAVVVNGVNYTVMGMPEADGTGMTLLRLEKV